jgi:hypothetical protein
MHKFFGAPVVALNRQKGAMTALGTSRHFAALPDLVTFGA